MAGRVFHLDRAAVLADNAVANAEFQPRAAGTGTRRKKRIEYLRQMLGGDAGPVVGKCEASHVANPLEPRIESDNPAE